jgi:AmpD protein
MKQDLGFLFPGKEEVVRQVQRSLRVAPSGIPSPALLGMVFMAAVERRNAPPPFFAEDRSILVKAIQKGLGIKDDGKDGPGTWSTIAQRLDPDLGSLPLPITPQPIPGGVDRYSERVLSGCPNVSRGRVNEKRGLILHHCAGFYDGTVSWCMNPQAKVSYHALIAQDGRRTQIVPDDGVAWHAGASTWKGRSGCNGFMLGLAFTGNTNSGDRRVTPGPTQDELASAAEWIVPRMRKYGWEIGDITMHRVVSPGRKDDTSRIFHERVIEEVVSRLSGD